MPIQQSKNDSTAPEFLSIKEICRRYSVGHSTIYDWVKHSQFPKPKKFGPRLSRWKMEDLLQWEAKQNGGDK